MMKYPSKLIALGVCAAMTVVASAQLDVSSWPTFRANTDRTGSVIAPGPATELAWTLGTAVYVGSVSSGGFATAANGDVYYKTTEGAGNFVFRIDGATGTVLAQSADIGGDAGNYGGVTVGVDKIYTVTNGAPSRIIVMNKTTLAIENEWDGGGAFSSIRGAPLISTVLNQNGNRTLYVSDRAGRAIHAVDAATGQLMWTHSVIAESIFGKLGPMWVTGDGRQAIAHFGNAALGGGEAIADNGDGTRDILWDFAGPDSFNWWGSGAMSADGTRIYVTTFNDGDTPSLWAIDITDGSVIWSVPGNRGAPDERNYFPRPSVIGNRIYCAGAPGLVSCFVDNGPDWTEAWEYRDFLDEHTAISVVTDPGTDDTYVYVSKQGLNMGFPMFIVLRDDGNSFTEMARFYKVDGVTDWSFNVSGGQIIPIVFGGNGSAVVGLDTGTNELSWNIQYADMTSDVTAAHFHGPADLGETADPVIDIGAISGLNSPMIGSTVITPQQAADMIAGLYYVNIHTVDNPSGEIRGQVIQPMMKPSIFGGNSCTIGADGGLFIGSGLRDGARGQIYKFMPTSECDPCDMDCDGDIDAFDIEPFLALLFDENLPPCCGVRGVPPFTGDTDGDGDIDAFDIEPFLSCLFP